MIEIPNCFSKALCKTGGRADEAGKESLKYHRSELDKDNMFVQKDEIIDMGDEPTHVALCRKEQEFLLKAIKEDLDLSDHLNDAMNSLRIVLAADESIRTGKTIFLKGMLPILHK